MQDPNRLSATDAARLIATGQLTSEALTRACLDRIAEREPMVRAWAFLDPELALEQARQRDREKPRGLLHGIPIGVKDIIDTADMPTAYGSPIYRGHRPARDADCVARIRAAGAVVLGKTVTTEFAWIHPGPTRNPHNPDHTPGGSSSGSAAGIADRMMPLAFGTQTGGSVIRPSSFCGVFGFKPTYNRYDAAGVKPFAPSCDTVGLHARTVPDIALLDAALTGTGNTVAARPPRRMAVCRSPFWSAAEPASRKAVEDAAAALGIAEELELPEPFARLSGANQLLLRTEGAQSFAAEYRDHRDQISPAALAQIEQGRATPPEELEAARRLQRACTAEFDRLMDAYDVLLTPSAPGEAPAGLASTGDAVFNRMWTTLHVPCVTLPSSRGERGLPVGVQLVARRGADRELLALAMHVADVLGCSQETG
jgi:Asp-tRNA(Asn)/Glu-tRNA(Gln) amidotransferase A subunit family amidase